MNLLLHSTCPIDQPPSLDPPPTPEETNPLDFLRGDPMFNEVKRIVKKNPKNLKLCLEKLNQTHPMLSDCIGDNLPSFIKLFKDNDQQQDDCEMQTDKSMTESKNQPTQQVVAEHDDVHPFDDPQPSTSSACSAPSMPIPIPKNYQTKYQTTSVITSTNPLFEDNDPPSEMDPAVVRPSDSDAIVRLMALGFSNLEAAGALVAFNRDEEKAADFLFSQSEK